MTFYGAISPDSNGDSHPNQSQEELVITGWFSCDQEEWLRNHQVGLDYARYNPNSGHFEVCLLSRNNYEHLRELQLKGEFPTPYYLTYSLGEVIYQSLQEKEQWQQVKRPVLPEWSYLVAPTAETRRELERWLEIHSPRLQILRGGKSDG